MHKVAQLEQRWFKYKMKRLISPLMSLSIFSVVVSGAYFLYEHQGNFLSPVPSSERATHVMGVSMEANNSTLKKEIPLPKTKESMVEVETPKIEVPKEPNILEEVVLSPIIPVIDMEKEERIPRVKSVSKHTSKSSTPMVKAKKNTYLTARELAVMTKRSQKVATGPRETKRMNFTTSSSNYIEKMKKKFAQSQSSRDALLLAKNYYKKADYLASEKWALRANKLDNSLEDSWLLFAKSKVKLGKEKEALKVLVSYSKKSQSIKAKRLIGQIKAGRI